MRLPLPLPLPMASALFPVLSLSPAFSATFLAVVDDANGGEDMALLARELLFWNHKRHRHGILGAVVFSNADDNRRKHSYESGLDTLINRVAKKSEL